MADVILNVKVVPGASRTRVAGRYADGIKVQVAAAPEKGRANDAVLQTLADWLGLKPGQLAVRTGHAQPRKQILITGLTTSALQQKLAELAK